MKLPLGFKRGRIGYNSLGMPVVWIIACITFIDTAFAIEDPWLDVFGLTYSRFGDCGVTVEGGIRSIPDGEGYWHYWFNVRNRINWGDGNTDPLYNGPTGYIYVSHEYESRGTYTVTVTALADCRRDHLENGELIQEWFYDVTDSESIAVEVGEPCPVPEAPLGTLPLIISALTLCLIYIRAKGKKHGLQPQA